MTVAAWNLVPDVCDLFAILIFIDLPTGRSFQKHAIFGPAVANNHLAFGRTFENIPYSVNINYK
jgi:hypothetical protein